MIAPLHALADRMYQRTKDQSLWSLKGSHADLPDLYLSAHWLKTQGGRRKRRVTPWYRTLIRSLKRLGRVYNVKA